MRYYTVNEILAALRVNNHYLKKLLERSGIVPQVSPHDGRLRIITEEEYARLKAQHDTELDALGWATDGTNTQRALMARVAELEAEITRLRRQGEQHKPIVSETHIPPSGERVIHRMTDHSATSTRALSRLIAAHSLYREDTGRKHLLPKMEPPDRRDPAAVLVWLKRHLLLLGRAGDWHECEDEGCACHAV